MTAAAALTANGPEQVTHYNVRYVCVLTSALVYSRVGVVLLVGGQVVGRGRVGRAGVSRGRVGRNMVGRSRVGWSSVGRGMVGRSRVSRNMVGRSRVGRLVAGQDGHVVAGQVGRRGTGVVGPGVGGEPGGVSQILAGRVAGGVTPQSSGAVRGLAVTLHAAARVHEGEGGALAAQVGVGGGRLAGVEGGGRGHGQQGQMEQHGGGGVVGGGGGGGGGRLQVNCDHWMP